MTDLLIIIRIITSVYPTINIYLTCLIVLPYIFEMCFIRYILYLYKNSFHTSSNYIYTFSFLFHTFYKSNNIYYIHIFILNIYSFILNNSPSTSFIFINIIRLTYIVIVFFEVSVSFHYYLYCTYI